MSIALLNCIENSMAVKVTAIKSAAGSAKYTAMALSAGNRAGMEGYKGQEQHEFAHHRSSY